MHDGAKVPGAYEMSTKYTHCLNSKLNIQILIIYLPRLQTTESFFLKIAEEGNFNSSHYRNLITAFDILIYSARILVGVQMTFTITS